ncbi:gnat family acetyltransferase protein [Rutstroemia sp. NJR-2017a WRK4]|nr:gnat family acetyltransferase protein [Rutstroemia sp. NJR-2017a WRK4]
MSRFTVSEATTRAEVDAVALLVQKANRMPYRPFVAVQTPYAIDNPTAMELSKEWFWQNHAHNPASHWITVHHSESGELVGAANWHINEKNAFPTPPPKIEATWWPEGEKREFANFVLTQAFLPRMRWMRRGCAILNILATHPDHRRQGVGHLLMQFGEGKAKELNLECWSEAEGGAGREGARFLLEKHGWKPLLKYCIYGTKENMSEEWQELCHKCLPQEQYAMWKPKGGVWSDDTVMPWDLGVEN